MKTLYRTTAFIVVFIVAVVLVAVSAIACQVPVFRYALERWSPDRYEVIVLHEPDWSAEDSTSLKRLQDHSRSITAPANFDVQAIDTRELKDQRLIELWREHTQNNSGRSSSLMVVMYPQAARDLPNRVAYTAEFTDVTVNALVQSPVRDQIADKLLDGDSAVWVFVPGGDAGQDAAAMAMLEQQLKLNESELELPPQDEIEADELFNADTNIELRIGFSIVTLDRQDPCEQFLLASLIHSETDLAELKEPMAFPVLGRGRVLYALVGKGIFRETIGMASRFIVGPCSCQVKEQNPGFDLLLAVDWDKQVGGAMLSKPLPEISKQPSLLSIPPGRGKP